MADKTIELIKWTDEAVNFIHNSLLRNHADINEMQRLLKRHEELIEQCKLSKEGWSSQWKQIP